MITAVSFVVIAIPMFGYPKYMPGKQFDTKDQPVP